MTRRPYTESEIRELIRSETAMQRIARKRRPVWPRVLRVLQRILRTA